MKKVTQLVLMLCLVLSGALCYARGNARTEMKKEGTPIDVIAKAIHGEDDKSNYITPLINGHVLMVLFDANLGQVIVEITTTTGGYGLHRQRESQSGYYLGYGRVYASR